MSGKWVLSGGATALARQSANARAREVGAREDRQPGHVGEHHRRDDREASPDPQQGGINRHIIGAHRKARGIAADDGDERAREQNAQDGARAAQHEALPEQRPSQRASTRAKRRPHRELALPAHGARQNEVGDIGARDDEHQARRREQHDQDRARGGGDLIVERRRGQPHLGIGRVRLRVFAHDVGVHRLQFRAGRFERRTGGKTAEQFRHAVRAHRDHGRPEVMRAGDDVGDDRRFGRIGHRRFEHANHRRRTSAEPDGLADDVRVAVERGAPEAVGQDRHARRVAAVVSRRNQPAKHRTQAHHVEVGAADHPGLHHDRFAEAEQREFDGGEVAKGADRLDPRLEIVDLRDRERHVVGAEAGSTLADVDQAIGVAINERPQEHLANDAEDRRVGADAEGKCDDDGRGQTLRAVAASAGRRACPARAPPPRRTSGCTRRAASIRGRRGRSRIPATQPGARPPDPRRARFFP